MSASEQSIPEITNYSLRTGAEPCTKCGNEIAEKEPRYFKYGQAYHLACAGIILTSDDLTTIRNIQEWRK